MNTPPAKRRILFVCSVNRLRSPTAEAIYAHDARFEVMSAGTDKNATTPLSLDLLEWADTVVVMERHHRNKIQQRFPEVYRTKQIVCLYVPDDYDFMQPELIQLLRLRFENVYRQHIEFL